MADFNKLMELVTDFGVESLRVGSYEARRSYEGDGSAWKLSMLREKRQEARERIAKALWELCNPVQPPEFQEANWGVDSVMRPCKSAAVSEYEFRRWAGKNGIALANDMTGGEA